MYSVLLLNSTPAPASTSALPGGRHIVGIVLAGLGESTRARGFVFIDKFGFSVWPFWGRVVFALWLFGKQVAAGRRVQLSELADLHDDLPVGLNVERRARSVNEKPHCRCGVTAAGFVRP